VPTYELTARFRRDFDSLTEQQKKAVRKAMRAFVADLRKEAFRTSLRVRGVQAASGIFEMTWAPDGRCTFEYGSKVRAGEPHVIWRRCGTHDVFRKP
jgi:hypothetical protein